MQPIQAGDVEITVEPNPRQKTVKLSLESPSQGHIEAELVEGNIRELMEVLTAAVMV